MKQKESLRQQRQAKALRENLLKRKEQQRARAQESSLVENKENASSVVVKERLRDVYSA